MYQARGIEIHIAGALYAEGYGNLFNKEAAPPATRSRIEQWEALGAKHGGFSLLEMAVGFAALPAGAKIVMGMKSEQEVESNLAAVAKAHTVPRALWREAQAVGMIAAGVPV